MPRRAAAMALVTAILPFATARAQDVRELTRRLDSAVARRDKAREALFAHRRAIAVTRIYPDTITIANGAVVVVTTHELLPVVRPAAARVDSMLRLMAGSGLSVIAGTVLAVRTDSTHRKRGDVIIAQRGGEGERLERISPSDRDAVARTLQDHALRVLLIRGLPRLGQWLVAALPIDTATDDNWRAVRLELVTSRASVARRCYGGDVAACKVTLGLTVDADPATAWYDSAARRAAVNAVKDRLDRVTTERCLAGSDTDCIALMQNSPMLLSWLAPPGSGLARLTLLQRALVMGGPQALERLLTNGGLRRRAPDIGGPEVLGRLLATDEAVSEGLSLAAKAPVDTVVAQWIREVRERGVASEAFNPTIALIAIGWILAMGALALRSPRWR